MNSSGSISSDRSGSNRSVASNRSSSSRITMTGHISESPMVVYDRDMPYDISKENRHASMDATMVSSGSFSSEDGEIVACPPPNNGGEGIEVAYDPEEEEEEERHALRKRYICLALVCIMILAIVAVVVPVAKSKSGRNEVDEIQAQTQEEYDALWNKACFQPNTCTEEVLSRMARDTSGEYPCGDRMQWLIDARGLSRWDACLQVATVEFPSTCGPCNPSGQANRGNSNDDPSQPGTDTVIQFEYVTDAYCYQPNQCTDTVLGTKAGEYPCGDRIQWLMDTQKVSLGDACFQVSVTEFPIECGKCDPTGGTNNWTEPDGGDGLNADLNNSFSGSESGDGDETIGQTPEVGGGHGGQDDGNDVGTSPPNNVGTSPPSNGGWDGGDTYSGELPPGEQYAYNPFTGAPFSTLDPIRDLNMLNLDRPDASSPSGRLQIPQPAAPTNAWYQNMIQLRDDESPTDNHRAYPIPYVLDANGKIPGLRVHTTRNIATATGVTLTVDAPFALTLGATEDIRGRGLDTGSTNSYVVKKATELGFTMEWDYTPMRSSIVRGMPYATMKYPSVSESGPSGQRILPTVMAEFPFDGTLTVDGTEIVDCNAGGSLFSMFNARRDVSVTFHNGLTWMIFVSQEVTFQCSTTAGANLVLQVATLQQNPAQELLVRLALVIPSVDSNGVVLPPSNDFTQLYASLLREHAHVYPGEDTSVSLDVNSGGLQATITYDWDATRMDGTSGDTSKLLTFALPHHQDKLSTLDEFCTSSLIGRVCLVEGSSWTVVETLPEISFNAPRRPLPQHLPALAEALKADLAFRIPDNYQIGAGDTYFGAKSITKLARILINAQEVQTICASPNNEYGDACQRSSIPTNAEMDGALSHLRGVLDVWFGNNAEAPFVYDHSWGGVVSCGCYYEDGHCKNAYPNCPSFVDQGLNFGNGFYNDHHFHYGYYIYSSAVVARFDQQWGRNNFEKVLLLVRDIANPSQHDTSFPLFRHKDWYFGASWASGITQPLFPNGMNQESSSEAIAAYESVALFGHSMRAAFDSVGLTNEAIVADEVNKIGTVMTATELRSTNRYWHVTEAKSVYPSEYQNKAVGILWSTMAQFGTWFGNDPYLIYGIQLLPITPIAEKRDEVDWAREMFEPLQVSCDSRCVSEGWSVQILALLATIGHADYAIAQARELPSFVFKSPGGSGHSKSNTIWYLSTRPSVANPYPFDESVSRQWESANVRMSCGQPATCTDQVLDSPAEEYTCGERIRWLINSAGMAEFDACVQIAATEYPSQCGACDPRQRRLGHS